MRKRPLKVRRLMIAGLVAAVAAGSLILVPAALESTPGNGLYAFVTLTNPGPLTACSDNCGAANSVREFVHVINANQSMNVGGTRTTLPNAYVVSSIDETILVNGAVFSQSTLTPPPNLTDRFGTAGHWPSTVTCGDPITVPCNVVTNPAILPSEITVIFYDGWNHGNNEPNGTYVFRFTVHGTLNGTSVNLTASSPPIQMTG